MRHNVRRTALLGLLFALSLVLGLAESSFSALLPIPGIKLGLSNIVVMLCMFCLGGREAYTLAVLKSVFVLLTRGAVGAAMSCAGGLVSVTVMLLLHRTFRGRMSSGFLSIAGGVSHNIGQLLIASLILKSSAVFYYLPVLAISGIGMGYLNGLLLRLLRPRFQTIFLSTNRCNQTPEEELEQ